MMARMGHQQGAVSGVEGWERSAAPHRSRGFEVAGGRGVSTPREQKDSIFLDHK